MAQVLEETRVVITFPDADVEDCEAIIAFGDDFGDNRCTFSCQLRKGHEGPHREEGDMGREEGDMGYEEEEHIPYVLTWTGSSIVDRHDD